MRVQPTRVLVVDDSLAMRQTLAAVLTLEAGFVVETAADAFMALRRMERAAPQVVVLDLEMPHADGLAFLRRLMAAAHPVPVVASSSRAGAARAMHALEQGAVAVVEKPRLDRCGLLLESAVQLIDTVRGAAQARVGGSPLPGAAPPGATPPLELPRRAGTVIAVGASTGGPEALRELLATLPPDAPAVLVVQHMPEGFTGAFAERLDQCCRMRVREAAHGDAVLPGWVLVAPGNRHLLLRAGPRGYAVHLSDGPLLARHRPSVDLLLGSVAQAAGANAAGVILTGAGADGAAGLLQMRQAGALTLAQEERSCVAAGMPRAAAARGAVAASLPLPRLAEILAGPAGASLSEERSRTSA